MAGTSSKSLMGKLAEILPPKNIQAGGKADTPTFNSSQRTQPLSAPDLFSHKRDLLTEHEGEDTGIIETLMRADPDVSASVGAYLTVANTDMKFICYDENNQVDRKAQQIVNTFLHGVTNNFDYSKGFKMSKSLKVLNEKFRYMILKRGSICGELIYDKKIGMLTDIRVVDTASLEWTESESGSLKPSQKVSGGGDSKSLDFPTIFYSSMRQDPNSAYSTSLFISVINTVYARTQIINDLYRLMNLNGFPRIKIQMLEEVIAKNAPPETKKNQKKMQEYVRSQISQTVANFQNIRPDQPLVHTDSSEITIMNEKSAGATLDIRPVIEVLNAQNQAALKTMATIIGRGQAGVNTASVEARIFSLSASELNEPLADLWRQMFNLVLALSGSKSICNVFFVKPELRADNELEPAKIQKQTRLKNDLSDGLITDDEYHMEMYGRLRPDSAPELSGTGFMSKVDQTSTDPNPNGDQPNSVQRQTTKKADKSANSNIVK